MILTELEKLINTKQSIKLALINKGANPSDEFASYADEIDNLPSGGGGGLELSKIAAVDPSYVNGLRNWMTDDNVLVFTDVPSTTNPINPNAYAYVFKLKSKNGYYSMSNLFKNSNMITQYMYIGSDGLDKPLIYPTYLINDSAIQNLYIKNVKLARDIEIHNNDSIINLKLEDIDWGNYGLVARNCSLLRRIEGEYITYILDETTLKNFGLFYYCASLLSIPKIVVRSGSISLAGMFYNCQKLTDYELEFEDETKGLAMEGMFYNTNFKVIKEIKNPKNDYDSIFDSYNYSVKALRVEGITMASTLSSTDTLEQFVYSIGDEQGIRYCLIKNIGAANNALTSIFTGGLSNWGIPRTLAEDAADGVNTQDARQSLIDTLITYSYDRAAAGKSSLQIKLYADTKALLTSDEIAQITAKGYTIA